MGNDPPKFSIFRHGRRATWQITREGGEGGVIIDTGICIAVFGSIALVSLRVRGSSL